MFPYFISSHNSHYMGSRHVLPLKLLGRNISVFVEENEAPNGQSTISGCYIYGTVDLVTSLPALSTF